MLKDQESRNVARQHEDHDILKKKSFHADFQENTATQVETDMKRPLN